MKQSIRKFAANQFSNKDDIPFSVSDYSKMKHGSVVVGRKFGIELADKFFFSHPGELLTNKILVMGSAYSFVRCAASIITDHFVDRLNYHLSQVSNNRCERANINRMLPYIADYGKLDLAGRSALLKSDEFSFDAEFAQGKLLIFLDDVVITGSHQVKIEEMLDRYKIPASSAFYLYYAELVGKDTHPDIESYLNNFYVKGLDEMVEIFMGEHEIVVRQLKMILSWPNHNEVRDFLTILPYSKIQHIYYQCLGEGYHLKESYEINFSILNEAFEETEYFISAS